MIEALRALQRLANDPSTQHLVEAMRRLANDPSMQRRAAIMRRLANDPSMQRQAAIAQRLMQHQMEVTRSIMASLGLPVSGTPQGTARRMAAAVKRTAQETVERALLHRRKPGRPKWPRELFLERYAAAWEKAPPPKTLEQIAERFVALDGHTGMEVRHFRRLCRRHLRAMWSAEHMSPGVRPPYAE